MLTKIKDILHIIIVLWMDNSGCFNSDEFLCGVKEKSEDAGQMQKIPNHSLPYTHIMLINKLANSLEAKNLINKDFSLRVSGAKSKKECKNDCYVSYDGNDPIEITEYDRQVYDAIVSLYNENILDFTASSVYRTMNGTSCENGISFKSIENIKNSIKKLCCIKVKIDLSNELKMRGIDNIDDSDLESERLENYLLDIKTTEFEFENSNGRGSVVGYHLNSIPILYAYSKLNRQYVSFPSHYMDIYDNKGKSIRNTDKRIVIKGYLIRRIAIMKGKTKQSKKIQISNLYNLCPGTVDRTQKKRIKDYAQTVLGYLEKQKYISGYKLIRRYGKDFCFDIQIE